jgi:hypothetical protein
MKLQILHVPDCPNVAMLAARLGEVLADRPDIEVEQLIVTDGDAAVRLGMAGSPTLLVDGTDPFAAPGQPPSLSCRLYQDAAGRTSGAPTVEALRRALATGEH